MKKNKSERDSVYHPDFIVEWSKYEKTYGKDAVERFTAWVESNGLDVEFPLQPQIEARLGIRNQNTVQGRQESVQVVPQKQTQSQVFGHPLFIADILTQKAYDVNDLFGYKVVGPVLDNKAYFEAVAERWSQATLDDRRINSMKKMKGVVKIND